MQHLSTACLPVSLLAGILPGPNVFLVYNGYRVHSHWKAARGGRHLQELTRLSAFPNQERRLSFIPCTHLEDLTKPLERKKTPLSDEDVINLKNHLNIVDAESIILRTRKKALQAAEKEGS